MGVHPNSLKNLRNGNPDWKKGGPSPNPSGKSPAFHDLEAYALAHTQEMLDVLIGVARNEKVSAATRVVAAEMVLNRAHGRPRQQVDANISQKNAYALAHLEGLKLVNEEFRLKERQKKQARLDADAKLIEAKSAPNQDCTDGPMELPITSDT